MFEGLVLDGEEALDALVLEDLDHLVVLDEMGELAAFGVFGLDPNCL